MDTSDKQWCLEKAIEIIKEKARGGEKFPIASDLEDVYKKLKELGAEIWSAKTK